MTTKQRRPNAGVTGVKAFIAATSLAATIGGWAAISNANAYQTASQTASTQAVAAQPANTSFSLSPLNLTPLPTLVPTWNTIVSGGQTTVQQATPQASQPTATAQPVQAQPTATTQPIMPTPVPSATTVSVSTTARPKAVTTTRSSR